MIVNKKLFLLKSLIKKIFIIFSLILVFLMLPVSCKKNSGNLKGTISISGAWALYPLAVKWVEEFKYIYPEIRIDISAGGAGKGMTDTISGIVDIGMISRDIFDEEIKKGAYPIRVAKDAVIPTLNENNPYIDKLLDRGLKKDEFKNIWINGKIKFWEELINTSNKNKINVYTRSDACGAASTWAKYMGYNQEDLLGIGVYGDPGLAEAVSKDIFGVGFNNINYAYDVSTKKNVSGIKIIPIDINENGKIDSDEDFYSNRDKLIKAIIEDKFPSPPARILYFVTKDKPDNEILKIFLKWILSEGQKYVNESGYINVSDKILKEELKKITD